MLHKYSSGFVHLITVCLIICVVSIGVIGYSLIKSRSIKPNVKVEFPISSPLSESEFINEYWGFELTYPSAWYRWVSSYGLRYYFASYDGEGKVWYRPNKSEIQVLISVTPSGFEKSQTGDLVRIGETDFFKDSYGVTLSNYEKYAQGRNGIPADEVNRERSVEVYTGFKYGFKYQIFVEPADSDLKTLSQDFVNSFSFITRSPLFKASSSSLAEGYTKYEDDRLGFEFAYPEEWGFRRSQFYPYATFENNSIWILGLEPRTDHSGDVLKDLKTHISLFCSTDGPEGSSDCPVDKIQIEPYTNKVGTQGYKINRKLIYTGTKNYQQNFIDFAYEINAPDTFAIVFSAKDEQDNDRTMKVADYFRYLEEK